MGDDVEIIAQDLLEDNPSLRTIVDQLITKAYRLARLLAVKETNLEETTFPMVCPYSWKQIADETFYSGPRSEPCEINRLP